MKENRPLTLLETIYPLVQGYDSCRIEADIEFGGTDQKFNLIVGRHLQQAFGQIPQAVVTMPILVGLDGKSKMSKSLGNYIGIAEDSKSMFGKLMSISDELMGEYFKLLSDDVAGGFKKMHPKEAKLALAREIVSFYHSSKAAQREKEEFERVFSKKKLPQKLPVYKVKKSPVDLVEVLSDAGLVGSRNEARRLLSQGGVASLDVDGSVSAVISEQVIKISPEGVVFKVGKRRFLKIVLQ